MVIFPLNKDKAPAVPKGSNWQDYKGEISTPMVGVMIPKGLLVIDVDTYKGATTDAIEFALGTELDWASAELQKTLSGGMHYAFRVNGDVRQGSDLLGVDGFDTRVAGKGYIATGDGYENLTFFDDVIEALRSPDDFPELSEEAIKALKHEDVENCDLMEVIASEPLDLSIDEVTEYVTMLSDDMADDQSSWLKVGMAIRHQLGDEGWPLFDAFSKRCPDKYDAKANKKRWESFAKRTPNNPVTFASVIDMAGGVKAKSALAVKEAIGKIERADDLDEVKEQIQKLASASMDSVQMEGAIKRLQSKYVELTGEKPSVTAIRREIKRNRPNEADGGFVADYVFLTSTAEYMHRDTKATMGPRAFDVAHTRETPLNGDGEKQSATMYGNDKIEVVENSMYFPKANEIFEHDNLKYINTYKAPSHKTLKSDSGIVDRIKAHIAHLLEDEREQRIVIDYLAHNVQRPGEKLNWAIVLQGVQGDGKSLLAEMMQHVMGFGNVRVMNVQTLESQFTGWATGQCMTFIEELKLDNFRKYEVLNNLKPYISNPIVEEHKKGKDPRSVINTTNYFALTNFKDAIPVDTNDRRYCVLFSRWQRKTDLAAFMEANTDYYPSLYDAMRKNIAEVYHWLMRHEISKEFLASKRAPDTNAKAMMTELSKPSSHQCLEDAIEHFNSQIDIGDGKIDVTQLGKLVKNEKDFDDRWDEFPNTAALKNALMNIGYELIGKARTPFSEGDRKHTVYSK